MAPLKFHFGRAKPLGATVSDNGCNFAVYSPNAKNVTLCLFDSDEHPIAEYPMPGKTGDVWHIAVADIKAGQLYGYRVDKPQRNDDSYDKLLIDPYAKALSRPCNWVAERYPGDSAKMVPKSVVVAEDSKRPWRPVLDKEAPRVIYEAHIKGLTQLHPDIPEDERGTYVGAAHPAVVQHLRQLGITTVQFLPCASFMPEPYITNLGLTNYWGYNPVNFFAVEPRYAKRDAINEFKALIDAYHEAGIEVIMDVVFNHTAEGGDGGIILSFKGLCESQAYLLEYDKNGARHYSNNSGCGNSFNTAHPVMLKLVMDALRYWVEVLGVDGFRFDLAASLGRDPHAFTSNAGFFRAIQQDPVLAEVLLVAEPWDIGMGGYQVGGFPHGWRECNDKFRDTVRAFWRGDKGITSDFATRVMGSRDIYHKGVKPICTSVNPVTYHDGFTLHDLVSYANKHNEANLEQNRDGHSHNLSANYGVEGPTEDKSIIKLRERQKRNFFATQLLSQGTPHILGGDELSRTQKGNNNAYCQDNLINWFDWQLDETQQAFLSFCREVIALRRSSRLLSELQLEDDSYYASGNVAKVNWYKTDGNYKTRHDWHENENQSFVVELKCLSSATASTRPEHWLICFNASDDKVKFKLPSIEPQGGWALRLDTRYQDVAELPKICVQRTYKLARKSIAIFTYSY